jgi:hypothetical protein
MSKRAMNLGWTTDAGGLDFAIVVLLESVWRMAPVSIH